MPTTTEFVADFSARDIGARTDDASAAVDDVTAEEDRFAQFVLSQGVLTGGAFITEESAVPAMSVDVGSNAAKEDYAVVAGTSPGQGKYVVRGNDATTTLTIAVADPTNPRIDEVYIIILDDLYDTSGKGIVKYAVRTGDPAASPSAPGPDSAWDAYFLLSTIQVAALAATIVDANITDDRTMSGLMLFDSERIVPDFADDTVVKAPDFQAIRHQDASGVDYLTIDTDVPEIDAHSLDIVNLFTVKGDVEFSEHVHDENLVTKAGQFATGPITLTAGAGIDQIIASTSGGAPFDEINTKYIAYWGLDIHVSGVTGSLTIWAQPGSAGSIFGAKTATQCVWPSGGSGERYMSGAQEIGIGGSLPSPNELQLLARRDNITGTQEVYHAWIFAVQQETRSQPPNVA